ncbi:hypothetical protein THAOC_37870, partial [Thalassiosira oceanica]
LSAKGRQTRNAGSGRGEDREERQRSLELGTGKDRRGRLAAVFLAGFSAAAAGPKPGEGVHRGIMKICGACVRELPDGSYSAEQRGRRQSSRRCVECVASGNQLVLMKKGRTRSEEDECPICQLLLPIDLNESLFKTCCMKKVCNGCVLAARKRGMRDCPFCRTLTPKTDSQILVMVRKRVSAGDPEAIYFLGSRYEFGLYGLVKDVTRAVELYERAVELGVKEAHFSLGVLYANGAKVEKDTAKACRSLRGGSDVWPLQHMMIAAKLGDEHSLNKVKSAFMSGIATKADYATALRGYQNAIEEVSSPDRDEAKAFGV